MNERLAYAGAVLLGVIVALAIAFVVHDEESPTVRTTIRTRLVVPAACSDALDHGDDLATLTGEAFGAAARAEDDLIDLLRRATTTTEDYKRDAARCRAHAT